MRIVHKTPKNTNMRRKTNKFDILASKSKSSKNFFYSSIANRFIIQRRLEKTLREVEESQGPQILKLEGEIKLLRLTISKYRYSKKKTANNVHYLVGEKKLNMQLETLEEKLCEVKNRTSQHKGQTLRYVLH